MVKISELRIGNIVLFSLEQQVDEIAAIETNTVRLVQEDEGNISVTDIDGIPLTPEILEKCGFEKTDNSNEYWTFWKLKNGWHISESHHNEPSAGVEIGYCYWGDDYIRVDYLHQLQNLYFALVKSELEIKL